MATCLSKENGARVAAAPTIMVLASNVVLGVCLVAILVAAVPVYIVSSLAFVRVQSLRAHEERLLATVVTNITSSGLAGTSSYDGVGVKFVWYYTKSIGRVRVVISLPDGYSYDAGFGPLTDALIIAEDILPAWACYNHPESDGTFGTWFVEGTGYYGAVSADSPVKPIVVALNNNPTDSKGVLTIASSFHASLASYHVLLGQSQCSYLYNDTAEECLPDIIGEVAFVLPTVLDKSTWDAKYDAVPAF